MQQQTTHSLNSIPFVSYSQTGFVLHPQAVTLINTFNQEKKVSVLAAIGKTKSGKSFLLNKLISRFFTAQNKKIQPFEVCNSVDGGTKGIRLVPIEIQNNVIIVLEMEGLGNLQNSSISEQKLFAITLLLSSILLYNTNGPLDEQSLQGLSVLVGIGKLLQHTLLTNTKRKLEIPQLFMVLRDFSLVLQDKNGESISLQQYFQNTLIEQKGTTNIVNNKNRIRRVLKQIFSRRQCLTLSYPSEDIPISKNSLIRKQFQKQIADFSDKLLNRIIQKSKKINGKDLNSVQWLDFTRQLINSINSQSQQGSLRIQNILFQVFRQQQRVIRQKFYSKTQIILKRGLFRSQQTLSKLQMLSRVGLNQLDNCIQSPKQELSQLKDQLQKQYLQSCRQMQELIEKQSGGQTKLQNINFNSLSLSKIKDFAQLYSMNQQVVQKLSAKQLQIEQKVAEISQTIQISEQLERQRQNFNNVLQQISLFQNEKQLQSMYLSFINNLRATNSVFDSNTLQSHLLKLEVAYLRRKIELKDRQEITKLCAATNSSNVLKDRNSYQNRVIKSQKKQNYYDGYRKNSLSKFQLKQTSTSLLNQNKKSLLVPYLDIEPQRINIQILRTFVKQDSRRNNFIEYTLEVVLEDKRWTFNRRWKDFNQLHNILSHLFQKNQLPAFTPGELLMNQVFISKKQEIQSRRSKLENYIRQLLEVERIRNSRIFQKFLKVNKEYVPYI